MYDVSREELRNLITTGPVDELFEPFFYMRRVDVVSEEDVPAEIREQPGWKTF